MIKIHPLSDVQSSHIADNTNIWQFCVILPCAVIGSNCNICAHVLIENDVVIGDNVTIKSGVQIWDGIRVGNNVFIGPNVTFTNDLTPRSKIYPKSFAKTIIKDGASIGANATIVAVHTVGEHALIGAGSVVTSDIPANTVWYGNPARQKGYITSDGIILDMNKKDKNGKQYCL
ncbi:MAG: N-acetyltransferase [Bacteroides sp.]|nr:N-acetyltransferase [Bacteroides sp.]